MADVWFVPSADRCMEELSVYAFYLSGCLD